MVTDRSTSDSTLSSPDSTLIVCDNLVKIYKVADLEVVALQGLDLVVERGELLGIVGASGSGKTTLMNILGGLDRPSAGRVWVGGEDLLKMSSTALDRYRRTKVGFVWQQSARNLIPYLTAQENVELPMVLAGQGGRQVKQHSTGLLEAVGLGDRGGHRLSELSGGEQQRVAIAVSLANKPQLLLADEPTGEVDEATALTIYETFRNLNLEYGLTTLIVSHDLKLTHHVDRVVAIRDGKTATETVRQQAIEHDESEVSKEPAFEELTVLDSAGRLQLPKEYLEQLEIKGRVRVELLEDAILIQPAHHGEKAQTTESIVNDLVAEREKKGLVSALRNWWAKRIGRRQNE